MFDIGLYEHVGLNLFENVYDLEVLDTYLIFDFMIELCQIILGDFQMGGRY